MSLSRYFTPKILYHILTLNEVQITRFDKICAIKGMWLFMEVSEIKRDLEALYIDYSMVYTQNPSLNYY